MKIKSKILAYLMVSLLFCGMIPVNALAQAGVAPILLDAITNADGSVIALTFSEPMADPSGKQAQFKATVGFTTDDPVLSVSRQTTDFTKIDLALQNPIASGSWVTVTYTKGDVLDADGDALDSVYDFAVNEIRVYTAETSSDGSKVVLTFNRNMMATPPAATAGEFSVFAGGEQKPVQAVSRSLTDPKVLELRLQTPIVSGVNVSFSHDLLSLQTEDGAYVPTIFITQVINRSTATYSPALDTLTLAPGTNSGTVKITAATTGDSYLYKMFEAGAYPGAPQGLVSGISAADAGVASWVYFTPNSTTADNIPVAIADQLAVVTLDAQGMVSQYSVHQVNPLDFGAQPIASSGLDSNGYISPVNAGPAVDGINKSLPLNWANIPQGTQSFTLVMYDATMGGNIHWMVKDIPNTVQSLAEGASGSAAMPSGSVEQSPYVGPWPPDLPPERHQYDLVLYALSVPTVTIVNPSLSEFNNAVRGKILGSWNVTGSYTPPLMTDPPAYRGSGLSNGNKTVILNFDQAIVNNTAGLATLKAAITFTSDYTVPNAVYSSLGPLDTVLIDGVSLIVNFDTPLAGDKNKIKIASGTLADQSGHILSTELLTGPIGSTEPVVNPVVEQPVVSVSGSPVNDIEASYSFDASTKLANIQLKQKNVVDASGFELSGLYPDAQTVFTITVNNNGNTPYIVLGAGDIQGWSSTGANGSTTIKVKGVHFKFSDNGPDIQNAVTLAIQYGANNPSDPSMPTLPPEYEGMSISTNGNQFAAPYKDAESGGLGIMVGGASGVTDGFFRAYLPQTLLQNWGVTSVNQLQAFIGNQDGSGKQPVSSPTVTSVGSGGMEISFAMTFSVHQVYVKGTYVGDFTVPNNSLLIGTHLFQLDDTNLFTAQSVQDAMGSSSESRVYFKSFDSRWYDLGATGVNSILNLTDLLNPDKALLLNSEKAWPLERWYKAGDTIEAFDNLFN
ncbi:hypothetical protein JCM15765_26150 [Paradesulfitobacterium aromaticivorans]